MGSDISGLNELTNNGNSGAAFEPGDVDSLVSEILFLSDNPDILKKRAENAYEFVLEKLTIQKVCDRIEKAYLNER